MEQGAYMDDRGTQAGRQVGKEEEGSSVRDGPV